MRSIFLLLLLSPSAWAVIFFSTADQAHNRETAPGEALAGSGWQYQGLFGSFLGTAISPSHFITAAHVGSAPKTFVSKGFFNGGSDITYTINTTANSGAGFWNITGTDLRIFQINGTFSSYAPLYTANNELGKELVVMGRGTQRGTTVSLNGVDIGWRWGSTDSKARWGTNQVAATVADSGGAQYLYATFDAAADGDEAHLSSGDSGGAVFIKDSGVWKLAGINYAVDGPWQYTNQKNETQFDAALFDASGMYVGSDASGWTLVPDDVEPLPSGFYSTRISSYQSQIFAITGVPEPGYLTLVAFAGLIMLRRNRAR